MPLKLLLYLVLIINPLVNSAATQRTVSKKCHKGEKLRFKSQVNTHLKFSVCEYSHLNTLLLVKYGDY